MEKLLKNYEKSLKIIENQIKKLKISIKNESDPRKISTLKRNKESYSAIKNDLLFAIKRIKIYLK